MLSLAVLACMTLLPAAQSFAPVPMATRPQAHSLFAPPAHPLSFRTPKLYPHRTTLQPLRMSSTSATQTAITVTKGAVGVAALFGIERGIWAFGKSIGARLPSAPIGMVAVFVALLLVHAVNEDAAKQVCAFFEPATFFFNRGVPLFFSPPLVQLPISLGGLPALLIAKIMSVIAAGTVLSLLTTGWIVERLSPHPPAAVSEEAKQKEEAEKKEEEAERVAVPPVQQRDPKQSPVLWAAVAVAGVAALLRAEKVLIIAFSLAALQAGKCLPAGVRNVLPAIVTCSALSSFFVSSLGGTAGLMAYKTGAGGLLGGSGPGDLLFSLAAPAIVALGFRLYEQRKLLQRHLLEIVGGSVLAALLSLAFTLASALALRLPAQMSLSLLTRFVTLPIAMPIADALAANLGIAALAICLQGILGGNIGRSILDAVGAKSPVARGVAIGAASHALGTASVASSEPEIAPASAVTFLVTGVFIAALFQLPAARALVLALVSL